MIEDLIRGLAAGSDLTAEEMLDVLWLSAIRAGPRSAPDPVAPSPPAAPDDQVNPERQRASPRDAPVPPPPAGQQEAAEVPLRLPADDGDDATGADADSESVELTPATEVGFGAPRPIRDAAALPRALRRLRQVRRPGPWLTVDVDATVEATADAGGTLVPVFTRPAERSLDLALVVDGAPAMSVWDDTFDEFARLMAQTGAFRSVERWRLVTGGEMVTLADASGKVQPTDRLIDPSGRRVVFVATSASADAWYTPAPWEAIAAWGAAMPTALIQVLPRQYWPGTALGEPYVTARAHRPAAPNAEYAHRLAWWANDPGGIPLPVVTLAPDALETWAQAAVTGTVWAAGITATPPDPECAPSAADDSADVLVNDFLSRASPGAEHLARILAAAATLSMPLIAVLQEGLAPETGVLEVAEVLSSGLLTEEGQPGQARFRFRFREDTRQLLRRGVTTFEEWDAYAAVSRYLESRHQLGGRLNAMLPDPDGSGVLDPEDEPFAALQEALATRLGLRASPDGQHPRAADWAITEDVNRIIDSPVPSADDPALAPVAWRGHTTLHAIQSQVVKFGRHGDNDVVIPDLTVSGRHAELRTLSTGQRKIVDLGSSNGTFVNDTRVTSAQVHDHDVIAIGKSKFRLIGSELQEYVDEGRVSLAVMSLAHRVSDSGRATPVLRDITFPLAERSMLAVIGPPGAGKTTLCNALTGIQPASEGMVNYDGRDLYRDFDAIEHRIGVIPQRSSSSNTGSPRPLGRLRSFASGLRPQSTPRAVLRYAARLRFARDTTEQERDERVNRVLQELSLSPNADVPMDRLSRKLVDIGLGLLANPAIIFLDDPFTPLDRQSAENLFEQLSGMANPASPAGRSVVIFARDTAALPLDLCDRILVLAPGGRMAYYGPPREGLDYFGRRDWADVYQMFRDTPNRDFAAEFRGSAGFQRHVAAPMT